MATNIWYIKKQLVKREKKDSYLKKIDRRIESVVQNLEELGIQIVDYEVGDPYNDGMALNVISSQPNNALKKDQICEVLKPTIYLNDNIIQAGNVVIEGPEDK